MRRVEFVTFLFLVIFASPAWPFGAEDPLEPSTYHHNNLSKSAAGRAGFRSVSAEAIAWAADYLDSYLYNPEFWLNPTKGGDFDRMKAALANRDELVKLHFDDLRNTEQIEHLWNRYLTGTVAGLIWAWQENKPHAAHHIIGISLHTVQDFYAHTNWLDDPQRRSTTWFSASSSLRRRGALYSGTYETPDHHGVKPHGKFLPACTVLAAPHISKAFRPLCWAISPLSNRKFCEYWRRCQNARDARPDVLGVRVPRFLSYVEPPGIALDSSWQSAIAVGVRNVPDLQGRRDGGQILFRAATRLAEWASYEWLKTLERTMHRLTPATFGRNSRGKTAGEFWEGLKRTYSDARRREAQFESYNRFGFQFLSAGPYVYDMGSSASNPWWFSRSVEQVFLRVRIKTSNDRKSGTNADIKLVADGQTFNLDYLPDANPVLAYDDFERGDDQVYTVGPLRRVPDHITLRNDAPSRRQILNSLWPSFKVNLVRGLQKIGDFFRFMTQSRAADHIGTNSLHLGPEELRDIGRSPRRFSIGLGNSDEGRYAVSFEVSKVGEQQGACGDQCTADYRVELKQLICHREGKWDRGSNSDEPFILALLVNMQGNVQKLRTSPYNDVDSGETRRINRAFDVIRVNKSYGSFSVLIKLMESDDETDRDRSRLLDEFAGNIGEESKDVRDRTSTLLGDAIGADWKIGAMSIYAFTRGPRVRAGYVFGGPEPTSLERWIEGRHSRRFPLTRAGLRTYVDTDRQLYRGIPMQTNELHRQAPVTRPVVGSRVNNRAPVTGFKVIDVMTREPNVDYYGGDYTSFVPRRADVNECSNACTRDRRCQAFTYVKPNAASRLGRCYLKGSLGRRRKHTCCISGRRKGKRQTTTANPIAPPNRQPRIARRIPNNQRPATRRNDVRTSVAGKGVLKLEKNIDYYGGDYASFVPKQATAGICGKACRNDKRCVAFTYVRPSPSSPRGKCYLKAKLGKRSTNPCCISGRR